MSRIPSPVTLTYKEALLPRCFLVVGEINSRAMIHHYTNIRSLALILKHKTLRFTRLDRFDDVLEAQRLAKFDFGSRAFASCWTRDLTESIPQWREYGENMEGVRISLCDDPFNWSKLHVDLTAPDGRSGYVANGCWAPFTHAEMLAKGYILIVGADLRKSLGGPVNYVSNVAAAYRKQVHPDFSNAGFKIPGALEDLARFKHDHWSFQNEYRFVLHACAGPEFNYASDPVKYASLFAEIIRSGGMFSERMVPQTHHIDLKVSQNAIETAEIVLGPLASEADGLLVQALTQQYAPSIKIRPSALTGTMRPR